MSATLEQPGPPVDAESAPPAGEDRSRARTALLILAGITAAGAALRFSTLGVQSYHHDEVITVMRVIPGSFGHMLDAVKASESNPPLYYVLAWFWANVFGSGEVGLRSLSALFGAATIPLAYPIGRELADRRTGLILAAMVAFNPMLIWYSQEARSYAPLVFFAALALLFFLRALRTGRGPDLGLWALASALALSSHYFAVFPVAIQGLWLLVALRARWRTVLPALVAVAVTGLALLPLIAVQVNPDHIGWIENSPLSLRFFETAVSFLIGETGHVIAQPPRERYAWVPFLLLAAALVLLLVRGTRRERRGGALGLVVGLGVVVLTGLAALAGKDYIVERNLLPALVPLLSVAAIGFAVARARRVGLVLAVALCAYWVAFDFYVSRTPNLQRPDLRALVERIGPPQGPRAIVTWKLAADSVRWYLRGESLRMYGGWERVSEVAIVSKALADDKPVDLPPSFRPTDRFRLDRLTLTRYVSREPMRVQFHTLTDLPTGFGDDAVVIDSSTPELSSFGAHARTTPAASVKPE